MSGKRLSIGQVMVLIALAAVSLAVLRAVPLDFLIAPTIWFFIGLIDSVIVWKLILRRRMTAFHYTALVALLFGFIVLTHHASLGSIRLLGFLVRAHQRLSAENADALLIREYLEIGDIWAAAFLSLLLALAAGWGAAQLERRLGWDIAALWRGAFLGLLIFTGVAIGLDQRMPPGYVGSVTRLAIFGACVIPCGLIGLRCLRSSEVQ